ncbi:bcl-2-related ovarian killer protein-like [Glandiceps talaboti]
MFQHSPKDEDDVVDQSVTLVREYINYKLSHSGLVNKHGVPIDLDDLSDVSSHIIVTGMQLESFHPNIYKDVCRKLHVSLTSETVVTDAFNEVANELFRTGITWPRIVSLFAFVACLASECVQQFHPDFVHTIVDNFKDFMEKRLAAWILERGGWMNVVTTMDGFRYNKLLRLNTLIGGIVGFVVGFLITGTT